MIEDNEDNTTSEKKERSQLESLYEHSPGVYVTQENHFGVGGRSRSKDLDDFLKQYNILELRVGGSLMVTNEDYFRRQYCNHDIIRRKIKYLSKKHNKQFTTVSFSNNDMRIKRIK